jgi:DNA-binding response OmpR family regulator
LDEGYRVLLAEDAFDAMTKLAKTTPSLILMDIEMPKMSGIDLLRRLRGQATTSALPVIMITALKDTELRRQAIDAGVTEYFIKPLTREGIARIRELLTTHLRHVASGSGI